MHSVERKCTPKAPDPEGKMMDEDQKLFSIFAPHTLLRREELQSSGRRLIHYTSAAAAISIIRNQRIWMRNVRCMNDFAEIRHGISLLQNSMKSNHGTQIEEGLNKIFAETTAIFPGIAKETIDWFNASVGNIELNTYALCLSEHDETENEHGRLSMWRAYTSGQVGVGLVLDTSPFYREAPDFGAYSSPVHYLNKGEINEIFSEISEKIRNNKHLLAQIGKEKTFEYMRNLLRHIAICTKHPGFLEEKEWRVLRTDGLDPRGSLELGVEIVNGIPQPIYKIPLQDDFERGMIGISIPALIERVIIGPTQFPAAVWQALKTELETVGVTDAKDKIFCSNIPVRS
jgi:hypothetical protein